VKATLTWELNNSSVEFRDAWQIADNVESRMRSAESVNGDSRRDIDRDGDDEEDEAGSEVNEEDDQQPKASPSRRQSVDNSTNSTAFSNFLVFISTICPFIPRLTYPLLLVVISTLPASFLPLETEPSLPLKNLFSHLWSPVDARLLSTHPLPGLPSAFQAFLRDTLDCTTFLISRSWKAQSGRDTALWLLKEQMGERIWGEGVLVMGGRSAGRRASIGLGAVEQEASAFGQAVARLVAMSDDLIGTLLPVLHRLMVEGCFSMEETGKKAVALLPRSLAILSAVREANTSDIVLQGLGGIIRVLGTQCIDRLIEEVSKEATAATLYADSLVDILRSYPTLVDYPAKKVSSFFRKVFVHAKCTIRRS